MLDASGARLNWAAIFASPGKLKMKSAAGLEKLGTNGGTGAISSESGVGSEASDQRDLGLGIPKRRSRRGPNRVDYW